jgi:anthranilate synthase component 1
MKIKKIGKGMDGDAGGLETGKGKRAPELNLSIEEYLTAVNTQPKPLVIPLCAELPLPQISPPEVYSALRKGRGFLLESIDGSEKIARYSFIGIDPSFLITIGNAVEISGTGPAASIARFPTGGDAVDNIGSVLSRFHYVNVKAPRFFGGMVGYFSYDMVSSLFRQVPEKRSNSSPESPMARFMFVKDCIIFDHRDRKLFLFCSPFLDYDSDPVTEYEDCTASIARLADRITALAPRSSPNSSRQAVPRDRPVTFTEVTKKDAFKRSVACVQEHIAAGDIFQAVISRRLECPVHDDPFLLYESLREINPSPYMYYLDFGDEQVIGASPEMLIRVEKRRVTTVPIAGTRPRGKTPQDDDELARDLLADEKERAEHTMLLDLARNDLGRVCRFGSVGVTEFMGVEKFSHVQHIVSTVNGVLRDHLDAYDALKSCFPAGTVSGAPKIRAMQIIGEQEPEPRGLYAGAVGYVGFDRSLEFAIAIRTIIVNAGRARVQVGAGIVADSVPENEWQETESKAAAMMRAIERAGVAL